MPDSMIIIGALAGAVSTLAAFAAKQLADRAVRAEKGETFWRDLHLGNIEKMIRSMETLGEAVTLLKDQARRERP